MSTEDQGSAAAVEFRARLATLSVNELKMLAKRKNLLVQGRLTKEALVELLVEHNTKLADAHAKSGIKPLPADVAQPRLVGEGVACKYCQSTDTIVSSSRPMVVRSHPHFLAGVRGAREPERVQRRYHQCNACGRGFRTDTPRTDPQSAPPLLPEIGDRPSSAFVAKEQK